MGFQVTPDQTAEQPAKLGTLNFHQQIVWKQTATKMVELHFDGPNESLMCSLGSSHSPEVPFPMLANAL